MGGYNIEPDVIAEGGIIGTILDNPEMINHSEFLMPNMFTEEKYSALYWAISKLTKEGITNIDDLTIIQTIKSNDSVKTLFKDDGVYNIRETLDQLRMLANDDVEEYLRRCRVVVTIDFKNKMYYKLEQLKTYLVNTRDDINDVSFHINDEVMSIGENYLVHNKTPKLGDKIDKIVDELLEQRDNGDIVGFLSKFESLNDYFTYEKGELIIIGGEKKSGKSILLMNEALHKAKQGIPTLVFDTELSDKQWIIRLLALMAHIKNNSIKHGTYSEDEKVTLEKLKEEIKNLPIAHIYLPKESPDWSFRDLYSFTKAYQQRMGVEFVVFDYIKAEKVSKISVKEHNYLGDLTSYLKNDIAGRLNIACLAAAQMSPHEMRLSDSDKLNRYASTVAYWMKKSPQEIIGDGKKSGTHKIYIDYNRLGRQFDDPETEYVNMFGDLDYMEILETEEQILDNKENRPWEIDRG